MKIEVGKFYKTRDGSKVRIYEVHDENNGSHPIHGSVFYAGNGWIINAWTKNGNIGGLQSVDDLVGLWEEPNSIKSQTQFLIVDGSDSSINYTLDSLSYVMQKYNDQQNKIIQESLSNFTIDSVEYNKFIGNTCECGAHATNSKMHSAWCRMSGKE